MIRIELVYASALVVAFCLGVLTATHFLSDDFRRCAQKKAVCGEELMACWADLGQLRNLIELDDTGNVGPRP